MEDRRTTHIPILCRMVPTDQWIRTHIALEGTVESLKVHFLETFLGVVAPKDPAYRPHPPMDVANHARAAQSKPKVETSRSWASSLDIFPAKGSSRSPLASPTLDSRFDLGQSPKDASLVNSAIGGIIDYDGSDDEILPSPVFARRPDYEYSSDIDIDDLDSPHSYDSNVLYRSEPSPYGSTTMSTTLAGTSIENPSKSLSEPPFIRKATSRVTFKPQISARPDASSRQITGKEAEDLARDRANNWSLYSFSNSHRLEENLKISDLSLKPDELIEVHRRGRFVPLSRHVNIYIAPYFDCMICLGVPKAKGGPRLRTSDRKRSSELHHSTSIRALSARSSSSSMKHQTTTGPSSSNSIGNMAITSRDKINGAPVQKFPKERDDDSNVEAGVPSAWNALSAISGGGQFSTTTAYMSQSHARPKSMIAGEPKASSSSSPVHSEPTPALRNASSMLFNLNSRSKSLQWKMRWLTIHQGYLSIWRDRATVKAPLSYGLPRLVSVREVIDDSMPLHALQTWRCLVLAFKSGNDQEGELEQVIINLPDSACHDNLFRILFRLATGNQHTASPGHTTTDTKASFASSVSSSGRGLRPSYSRWRAQNVERAVNAGRADERDAQDRRGSLASTTSSSSGLFTVSDGDDFIYPYEARYVDAIERDWEDWEKDYGGRTAVLAHTHPDQVVFRARHQRERSDTVVGSGPKGAEGGVSRLRTRTKSFTNALPGVIRGQGSLYSNAAPKPSTGVIGSRPRSTTVNGIPISPGLRP